MLRNVSFPMATISVLPMTEMEIFVMKEVWMLLFWNEFYPVESSKMTASWVRVVVPGDFSLSDLTSYSHIKHLWWCHCGDVIKCDKGMRQQFEITLIASILCFCWYYFRNEVFDQITRLEKVGKVDGSYFRKPKAAFCAVGEREAVFLGLLQWDGSSHLSPCSLDWITFTGSLCTRTSVKIPSSRQAASHPLYTVMRVTVL